jgi:hypothetical protein
VEQELAPVRLSVLQVSVSVAVIDLDYKLVLTHFLRQSRRSPRPPHGFGLYSGSPGHKLRKVEYKLPQAKGPELFVGIAGPIGTDLDTLCTLFSESLRAAVGYTSSVVRLIDLVREMEPWRDLPREPIEQYYHRAMTAGDEFRAQIGRGDALAVLAMREIQDDIRKPKGGPQQPLDRHAYILRSTFSGH